MVAGCEFAGAGQNPVALLVVLADHTRVVRPVEHVLLHLRLDEGALFFHDQNVFQAFAEALQSLRFERPSHTDLIDADTDIGGDFFIDAEVFQRLQHIKVALAGGDDAEARTRRIQHHLVDLVGARKRLRSGHRITMQAHFLIHRRIGPADIQAAARHIEIIRRDDVQLMRIDVDRTGRFDGFSNRLEPDPAPSESRHRPAQQAHVENVLHTGRIQHRHHRGDEFQLRAMRQGGTATGVVIGRQGQHATKTRSACGVAVLEHVTAAIHTRPLAVPHREHAVVPGAFKQVGLLTAPDHGGAQIFVDAGREMNGRRRQVLARLPQLQIKPTERTTAIAGNETRRVA
jgi:hypothetical protein